MNLAQAREQLAERKRSALYREKHMVEWQNARHIKVNGRTYLNFSSNDYLGLNQHPDINKSLQEGADKFGVCSSASSLITGFQYAHQSLEQDICEWLGVERCLLFNSGFSANQAVLSTFQGPETKFWLDKLSHASLIDGVTIDNNKFKRFLHNDVEQLERLLSKDTKHHHVIVSEGVFSMDGDSAPIQALQQTTNKHDGLLYLDDAHSIGVSGENGRGSLAVSSQLDFVMATLGKAIATSGAFVTCSQDWHDYFVNFARHYVYSTAMSPAIAWATKKSIEIVQKEQWRRDRIKELSALFSATLNSEIEVMPTQSSIHAVVLGKESHALKAAQRIRKDGFWLTAIRPPTVPTGTSRLRVTICATHKDKDIINLAESINRAVN